MIDRRADVGCFTNSENKFDQQGPEKNKKSQDHSIFLLSFVDIVVQTMTCAVCSGATYIQFDLAARNYFLTKLEIL